MALFFNASNLAQEVTELTKAVEPVEISFMYIYNSNKSITKL